MVYFPTYIIYVTKITTLQQEYIYAKTNTYYTKISKYK